MYEAAPKWIRLWTGLLLLACAVPILAQEPKPSLDAAKPCAANQHLQLTLGLPKTTRTQETPAPPAKARSANAVRVSVTTSSPSRTGELCVRIVQGSPYALLDWLEHGEVQAALVSPFAADVMRADDPVAYDAEYVDFPASTITTLPSSARTLVLQDGAGQPVPITRLDELFAAFAASQPGTIILPDHLSPAVPMLISRAAEWIEQRKNLGAAQRDSFLRALIGAIHFQLYPGAVRADAGAAVLQLVETSAPEESSQACSKATPVLPCLIEDRIIVRRRSLERIRGWRTLQQPTRASSPIAALTPPPLFSTEAHEKSLGDVVQKFRESNYQRYQVGNLPQRYFRFSIDELWSILRHERSSWDPQSSGLALVLTGGGVKAAYQTRMIDHLYGDAYLVNATQTASPPAPTEPVRLVIGTSGGALLGVFVSALDDKMLGAFKAAHSDLTQILWKTPGAGIEARDVFPFLDMPRYATVLVAFLVLMLAAKLIQKGKRLAHAGKHEEPAQSVPIGPGRRTESICWYVLLILAPLIIISAARVSDPEHVPPETGIVYAVMLLIAVYSDVRLTRKARLAKIEMNSTAKLSIAIAIASLLLIVGSFWIARSDGDHTVLFIVCSAMVALAFALHLFFRSQVECFDCEPRAPILNAFLVVVAIVLASYAVVAIVTWIRLASLLEVTLSFWGWFLATTAVISLAAVVVANVGWFGSARTWLQSTFSYLLGEYRSWTHRAPARRYARLVAAGFIAWMWWNLIAAPGLYGNANAHGYFQATFDSFRKAAHLQPTGPYPLSVPFVITATSLEKERELYFLFLAGGQTELEIDTQVSDPGWSRMASDSRWFVQRNVPADTLRETAFASGSPFPVFAAHNVKAEVLRTPEHLIDGGFAHNRPLDAARVLDAQQVLVVNSSPLDIGKTNARCQALLVQFGELACNLPKLVPYLWERSQIEDILSTRGMFVASIYPTAEATAEVKGWPLLTDFRGEVVEKLVDAADKDRHRRVGVVESWGQARETTTMAIRYDLGRAP